MSLRALRDEIVETLKIEVPQFVSVEPHDGNFDLQEIQRHFGHYPRAARVVCPGVAEIEDQGGVPVARSRWVVFVAAREQNASDPDGHMSHGDACMVLAQRVMALVHGRQWNCKSYGIPERIVARNLYTGQLDKRGLSLWAVEWEQDVIFDDRIVRDLDRLRLIHTDYELSEIHEGPESSTTTVYFEPPPEDPETE
jgi:hypothetical protein